MWKKGWAGLATSPQAAEEVLRERGGEEEVAITQEPTGFNGHYSLHPQFSFGCLRPPLSSPTVDPRFYQSNRREVFVTLFVKIMKMGYK